MKEPWDEFPIHEALHLCNTNPARQEAFVEWARTKHPDLDEILDAEGKNPTDRIPHMMAEYLGYSVEALDEEHKRLCATRN